MKKVSFFSIDMRIGGVERQLYYLVNGLLEHDYQIELILCEGVGDYLGKLDRRIKVHSLGTPHKLRNYMRIMQQLRARLEESKPNLFVCFHSKLNSLAAGTLIGTTMPLLCCFPGFNHPGKLNWIRRILMNRACKLVAVSNGVRSSLIDCYPEHTKKISVVDNAVDIATAVMQANLPQNPPSSYTSSLNPKYIVASVGRLEPDKDFFSLINAASYLSDEYSICIIGDGTARTAFEAEVGRRDLGGRVFFTGFELNPYRLILTSSVFVLSPSKTEGLPSVLLEAMALNIPCICPEYLGRTDDVICHKINGIVIRPNDPQVLAEAIKYVCETADRNQISEMVTRAAEHSRSYDLSAYVAKFHKLLSEISG